MNDLRGSNGAISKENLELAKTIGKSINKHALVGTALGAGVAITPSIYRGIKNRQKNKR